MDEASNRLPPSLHDAIAASSGEDDRRRKALSDDSPGPPSTMTAHTASTSDSGRLQEDANHLAGAYGSLQCLPTPCSGGGGGSGKDLKQQLRALQAQNAEWRRRAEAAEEREKVLLGQLRGTRSVVTKHVDQLITALAALAADADRSGPDGQSLW